MEWIVPVAFGLVALAATLHTLRLIRGAADEYDRTHDE